MGIASSRKVGAFALGAGIFLAAGAASAAQVEANGGYSSNLASVWNSSVITATVNGTSGSGYAGIASFTRTGSSSDDAPQTLLPNSPSGFFYGICLEFNETIQSDPKLWELQDLSAAPVDANGSPGAPMNSRASDMAKLLNGAYASWGSTPISQDFTTALQMAVWEIANEDLEGSAYNLTANSGRFFVTGGASGAALSLAQSWLGKIGNEFNNGSQYYMALTNNGQQDFLVKVVPIPAAAWLLGSGLLGLFGLVRRKSVAAAT